MRQVLRSCTLQALEGISRYACTKTLDPARKHTNRFNLISACFCCDKLNGTESLVDISDLERWEDSTEDAIWDAWSRPATRRLPFFWGISHRVWRWDAGLGISPRHDHIPHVYVDVVLVEINLID